MLTPVNEKLIHRYLEIVSNDDYEDFGKLLTDDCTFTLMPSGRTFKGRQEITAFTLLAGGSRTHTKRSKVVIKNWFTDGQYLCVEYDHTAIIQALHLRITIDGYCYVFHMRDGKFDAIREYINPSSFIMNFCLICALKLVPFLAKAKLRRLKK